MRIAIVGLGCRYPDANSPEQLWENILAKRQAFRRLPPERLSLSDYFSPDPNTPDAFYSQEVAVIEGYEFDRIEFRISGPTYRSADLSHWLALDVANQALIDAGFPNGEGLPRETTGVLVGNTLTGEFSRAQVLRLRWPYVRRVVAAHLAAEGWESSKQQEFLAKLEERYQAPFAPVGEETLAGGLSNTIAGRICNHFGLRGGGYTVDGACSSSLLAVAQACLALEAGELDAALVGGVDLSLDPFELVGFAKAGALAKDKMRVYDQRSCGFWPGEGCGFVVLLREEEARALGFKIYALISGFGISSDGGGGITRPEICGQRLAIERAYRRAGYSIASVSLIEGHGTGTQVGDEVELATLSEMLSQASWPVAIGSIKANIGHTKAAAGIAGLIKATLALHHQILPPTTGVETPHRLLDGGPLRALQQAEVWPKNRPRRAGVSSFGFGGINVHLTLEGISETSRCGFTASEQKLLAYQDAELFLLGAQDLPALLAQTEKLIELAPKLSYAELTDLAACLCRGTARCAPTGPAIIRAALVASTPKELAEQLAILHRWLAEEKTMCLDPKAGVFLGSGEKPPRIAFLFSGQASPVRFAGGIWARRFASVHELYEQIPFQNEAKTGLLDQLAIVAAELAGLRVLNAFGLQADLALGHSLGELTALHWAGAMDEEDLLALVQTRAQAMAEAPGEGAMASLAAEPGKTQKLLEEGAVIAGFNASDQTVISGKAQAIARVLAKAKAQGIAAVRLPVSHAFHSPLMRPVAKRLAEHLGRKRLRPLCRRVLSTVTGGWLQPIADLSALLVHQLTSPVRFTDAIAQIGEEVDLLLEVGPGQVLANLVPANCHLPVISLDCAGSSLRGLLSGLGAAFALGAPLKAATLFADRFFRPFDLERNLRFFANPCELAPDSASTQATTDSRSFPSSLSKDSALRPESAPLPASDTLSLLRQLVAERTQLPEPSVQDDYHLLKDLHLNSISVGQIVVEAAKRLGVPAPVAPTEYATATLAQAAQALEALRQCGPHQAEIVPAGVDSWVRAFAVEKVQKPQINQAKAPKTKGRWQVFAPKGHPLAPILAEQLQSWGGSGVLVCLPVQLQQDAFCLLLAAAHAALEHDGTPRYFVLVQHAGIAASFARTLSLEAKELTVCVVDVPPIESACAWVLAEVHAAQGYSEAYYDAQGRRYELALRLLDLEETPQISLGANDVLLISGGGKGIAAECGLELARTFGVKLALIGRSRPETDPDLAHNLARFAACGVVFRYYAADVTDAYAVNQTISAVQAELGPVTAILHGAGINEPIPLIKLDAETLTRTLAPKLQGLKHLLATVDPARMRLLISFSSIIGAIGFAGEADYALANAALSRLTEEFQAKHPNCRCLALEWSIWSGVGMGERLGRVDALLHQGISPISPEVGVFWLKRLLCANTPVRVIVSSRLGPKPPLPLVPQFELPFWRFLENPRLFYPGIELVIEAELSSASDPYLDDHVFQGERLLPAVLGLEAMAQAACAVTGRVEVPAFEDVQFLQPIVVGDAGITLRLAALAHDPNTVEVVLRSSQSGFQRDCFRAVCRFSCPQKDTACRAPTPLIPLDPKQDLYGKLLFQGGRFQRLIGYLKLEAFSCLAEIAADEDTNWFAHYLPQELLLGDPGSRDAAIHAIQSCIPQAQILPVGIERWSPGDLNAPGPWTVEANEHWQKGEVFCYDLAIYGADRKLHERFEGLRLRRIGDVAHRSWPLALLAPYLERRVKELTGADVRLAIGESEAAIHHVLGKAADILRRPDGKPIGQNSNKAISAAHAVGITLAAAGQEPLACDLEIITERSWRELLGERYGLAELIAHQGQEDLNTAATRVWTAVECLKKGGFSWDTPVLLHTLEPDRWAVLKAGSWTIASWPGKLKRLGPVAVAVLVAAHP